MNEWQGWLEWVTELLAYSVLTSCRLSDWTSHLSLSQSLISQVFDSIGHPFTQLPRWAFSDPHLLWATSIKQPLLSLPRATSLLGPRRNNDNALADLRLQSCKARARPHAQRTIPFAAFAIGLAPPRWNCTSHEYTSTASACSRSNASCHLRVPNPALSAQCAQCRPPSIWWFAHFWQKPTLAAVSPVCSKPISQRRSVVDCFRLLLQWMLDWEDVRRSDREAEKMRCWKIVKLSDCYLAWDRWTWLGSSSSKSSKTARDNTTY